MDQILSILGSVGFNWHVALANFINFLIILFILNKFFFGKLGNTISSRQKIISRGLEQASDAEKALAHAENEKKKIVSEAKKEGHSIISLAQEEAEKLAQNIKREAEEEITSKMNLLEEKEARLKEKVEKEFAESAPVLVAQLYAKSLKKNLTEDENNKLIASMN